MKTVQIAPVFVKTKNVRNFEVMMDALALGAGEGRFGMVWGESGRGKTRTTTWYHAHHGCAYLATAKVWQTSPTDFLHALARELGIVAPAPRKGRCFAEVVDALTADPRPVFIDEIERLGDAFLEILRDITNSTGAPVVLIGEEELVPYMRRNRRVWTRTFQQLEFAPLGISDVIVFANEAAALKLTPEVADVFHRASTRHITAGNFRLVKRTLLALVQICNAKGTREVSVEMARVAVKTSLAGA